MSRAIGKLRSEHITYGCSPNTETMVPEPFLWVSPLHSS
jgi:hypothetical protein